MTNGDKNGTISGVKCNKVQTEAKIVKRYNQFQKLFKCYICAFRFNLDLILIWIICIIIFIYNIV